MSDLLETLRQAAEDDCKVCSDLCGAAADALEQKAQRIKELERAIFYLTESLDEAKYSKPKLRSKLDKQRQRIEQLEAVYKAAIPVRDSIMSEVKTVTGIEACNLDDALNGFGSAGNSAPLDGLKPAHECEKIASAIMAEGRDWWVGKLTKPVPGHEIETHCLHLTTPLKDVVFLVNDADFQWLTVLGRAACGPISERWLESVTRGAIKRAVPDEPQTVEDQGNG